MRRTFPVTALTLVGAVALSVAACRESIAKVRGVGDKMSAFIVQNCETAEKYCQVCQYGGKPKIMAIGDIDDKAFEQDLVRIQKVLDSGKEEGLVAFAVVGKVANQGFQPLADEKGAMAKLDEMKKRLGLTFPVVIVPKEMSEGQKKNYAPFNAAYEIAGSRQVFFAGADNKILFAEVIQADKADAQFKTLAETVTNTL
jgi:hypothetical protein